MFILQVSSTNFNSRKSIANLEKALIESKKREELQKRLILQLQEQKKTSEEKKKALLNAAENLRMVNTETSVTEFWKLCVVVCSYFPAYIHWVYTSAWPVCLE